MKRTLLAAFLLIAGGACASAQTIGYAGAIDRVSASCRADIQKHCKNVNLGGGRMLQCLDSSGASPSCRASITAVRVLVAKRAEARALIPRVCDADIRRVCAGVQPGDGNLMECFYKAKRNISPPCQQAVADAGYE
jgi:hypothetical protein